MRRGRENIKKKYPSLSIMLTLLPFSPAYCIVLCEAFALFNGAATWGERGAEGEFESCETIDMFSYRESCFLPAAGLSLSPLSLCLSLSCYSIFQFCQMRIVVVVHRGLAVRSRG